LWGASTSRLPDPRERDRTEQLKRWVAAPLTAAGLAAAAIAITASSLFGATTIEITGDHRVPRERIVREAGLDRGTNVFWLRGRSAARLLLRDPWVASATVTRELPSTIRIRIVERRPASQVRVGSTWLLVAADGTALGPTPRKRALPVLPSVDSVTTGKHSPALDTPARIAAGLDPWVRVRTLEQAPGGRLRLQLSGGTTVLFGAPTALRAKERALGGIVRWGSRVGVHLRYVDLRAPLAPAVRVLDVPS
jgi:cell division septal protein FtsQ